MNYLDDLLIYSSSYEEHLKHVEIVLKRLHNAGLTLNPDKIKIAVKEVRFLGHVLTSSGLKIDPDRIQPILGFPAPRNLKQLRRFLGMAGFFHKFISGFADISEPLNKLKRKGVKFLWGKEQEQAFVTLKERLATPPLLLFPDFSKPFLVQTDASSVAIAGVINQEINGNLAPVAYTSRLLNGAERNYSVYEKECLAIIHTCERFQSYLEHSEFILQTDNQGLSWLRKHLHKGGKLNRWFLRLSAFKFKTQFIKGNTNKVSDCLSRMYQDNSASDQTLEKVNFLTTIPEIFRNIRDHQEKDQVIQEVKVKIQRRDPSVKEYKLQNNLVVFAQGDSVDPRILVPANVIDMVLKYYHDSPCGGHLGFFKTYHRIASSFYWPKMRSDISEYVHKCDKCQRSKPPRTTLVGKYAADIVSNPMERIFIDFFGPLTRTTTGFSSILIIVDGFSKFVSMFPVRQMTSATVINVLSKYYFPAFGMAKSIVSDNASCFRSQAFKNFCFNLGVRHFTTSPYYPKPNHVERFNRNLKIALTIYHSENQRNWDTMLSHLSIGFNSAIHEATQKAPAVLFLGRKLLEPLDLNWEIESKPLTEAQLKERWREALESLKRAQRVIRKRYNENRVDSQFKVGDTVVVRLYPLSSASSDISAKLAWKWSSPCTIRKMLSPVTAEVVGILDKSFLREVHVSQIKYYHI